MKPQLSRPGWELPVLDLISYGPTVTRNTTQHSISYTVSAFLWHYWNGLDELSMVLSVVGTQPDTGDPAPDHPRRYRLSWKVMVFHESALCPIRVMGWKKAGNHWSRNLHSRILLPRISSDCYPKPGGVGAGFFFFFHIWCDQPECFHLSRLCIFPTMEGKYCFVPSPFKVSYLVFAYL